MNNSLFKHVPAITIGALIGVGLLFLRGCFVDKTVPSFKLPLAEETLAQIAMEDHHIAIRTHRETKAAYVPDAGGVTAEVNKKGDIKLNVRNKGLTFKPVAGVMVSNQVRGVVGAQVGYWNRFELYVGGGFPKPVAFVGLGYRLDQIKYAQNTSLAVAYTSDKTLGLNILVRF
jgi:hypothetical protein